MGPLKEENQNDIIEMEETVKPINSNEEDWNHNEETDESETMLLNNLKMVTDPQEEEENEESFWLITFQVFFPFLIAGLGMVGAGLVLDIVQVSMTSWYFERILQVILIGKLASIGMFSKL